LKYFLECILTALLISYIVAESGLLVELGEGVGRLLETYFEAIKVNVGSIYCR
jgi:hypothetical protein